MTMQQRIESLEEQLARQASQQQKLKTDSIYWQKQAKAAEKRLQEFVYIVSHDLKAPLRSINSLTSWLLTDHSAQLDGDGQELMGLLNGRVHLLNRMMEALLVYSRIGRFVEEKAPVSLEDAITSVMAEITLPSHIRVTNSPDLPDLFAEPIRLQQLMHHLLDNAVQYIDKADGQINVTAKELPDFWQVQVADNGCGIEEKHFERIFQIFQRLDHREEEGTHLGVGLTLAKKIVEFHGGQIWVESESGQGSSFIFTWPKQ